MIFHAQILKVLKMKKLLAIFLMLFLQPQNGLSKNFVVVIADDLAWNDLGCYGHPFIKTPNIDRIASQGLTFTNAYLTTSSCSPSRCSILTSQYPHNTGAGELHLPLPNNKITLAKVLKENGYYTASAGKWHLGNHIKTHFDKIYKKGGVSGADEWVTSINEAPSDKPFFLWLAASDPHRGYRPNSISEPHSKDDVILPPFIPDTQEIRDDFALYYDEVSRFDEYIGRILKALEKKKVMDQTAIFIMSDNGRPFPRCKTTLYDSGIKTPVIALIPKVTKPGSKTENLISSIDLASTILDLANIQQPKSFQGVSFVPLLKDPSKSVRQFVFAEHNWHDYMARESSVRSKQFLYISNDLPHLPLTPPADAVNSPTWSSMRKLLSLGRLNNKQFDCFISPRPHEQLFDTEKDPFQLNNLAEDPDYKINLKAMRETHDKWRISTEYPTKNISQITPDGFDRVTGKKLIKKAHPSFD